MDRNRTNLGWKASRGGELRAIQFWEGNANQNRTRISSPADLQRFQDPRNWYKFSGVTWTIFFLSKIIFARSRRSFNRAFLHHIARAPDFKSDSQNGMCTSKRSIYTDISGLGWPLERGEQNVSIRIFRQLRKETYNQKWTRISSPADLQRFQDPRNW